MQPDRRDREGGNAALELVVLAPILLFLISLVIAVGRTSIAQGSVAAAARDAARQASISRTPGEAMSAAQASATAELAQEGLACIPAPVIDVNVQGFGAPIGQPATVSATVSCRVSLSDLVLPGIPGSRLLTKSFTSPLDPYRGR